MLPLKAKAFTLVEIMIVVAIIGIIIAIAVPAFLRARETARSRSCQENLSKIQGAIDMYALEFKKNGNSSVALAELVQDNGTGYLRAIPECAAGGVYTVTVVKTEPTCSIGENVNAPFAPHVIDPTF